MSPNSETSPFRAHMPNLAQPQPARGQELAHEEEFEGLSVDLGALVLQAELEAQAAISPTPFHSSEPPMSMEPCQADDVFGADEISTTAYELEAAAQALSQRIANRASAGGPGYNGFIPRADRIRQGANASNAQGLYPPTALVFVANLSSARTAEQLENACQQVFSAFGPCHSKVRLDRNKHPFAFVQFEYAEDASAAVDASYNLMIDGRKIRVERAKADRAVIMSRLGGGYITEAEVRRQLDQFGPIEVIAPAQTILPQRTNVHGGMYVKFAYYLDCQDALKCFPHHTSGYILVLAPSPEARVRYGAAGSPVVRGFATPRSVVDMKSIFVGNLPDGTTRQELYALFEGYGSIVQVNVIRKTFGEDTVNVFGFVEFSSPLEAEQATLTERHYRGVRLRIEPKEYSARRQPRGYAPPTPSYHPTPRSFHDMPYPGAPRVTHAQPFFEPAPHMEYNHAAAMAEQSLAAMQSYNPYAHAPYFSTPPHNSIGRLMNAFSPTPAHHMSPFTPVASLAQAPQYAAQPFGSTTYMNPIEEADTEEY